MVAEQREPLRAAVSGGKYWQGSACAIIFAAGTICILVRKIGAKYFVFAAASISLLLFVARKGSDLIEVYGGIPKVKLAQLNDLKIGMAKSDVENIIGGKCVLQSEGGEVGTRFHTVMYG